MCIKCMLSDPLGHGYLSVGLCVNIGNHDQNPSVINVTLDEMCIATTVYSRPNINVTSAYQIHT